MTIQTKRYIEYINYKNDSNRIQENEIEQTKQFMKSYLKQGFSDKIVDNWANDSDLNQKIKEGITK